MFVTENQQFSSEIKLKSGLHGRPLTANITIAMYGIVWKKTVKIPNGDIAIRYLNSRHTVCN